MIGTIFDIKEFSVYDGPGARITVFMKGCPLRCKWCHNPEGLSTKPQLMYKTNICSKCGNCKKKCTHPECEPFDRCIHSCPNGCLSVSGTTLTARELADKLLKNRDFFENLHGGVTISGGEPLMQGEFVAELAELLAGVHKAIQTSGYAEADTYKKVIEKFDYVLQDIKIADSKLHKEYTGVSNEKILNNIEYLKKSGKQFVFRVPLIPNITDTDDNLKGLSEIAEDYPVELLKYNPLAGAKYSMLGMEFPLGDEQNRDVDFTSYFCNAKLLKLF